MPTYTYNWDTKIVTVDSPDTTTTLQQLLNSIRAEEEKQLNLDNLSIAVASGKIQTDAGPPVVTSAITMELINGWRLAFEARGGPSTVLCTVTGGTLVAWTGSQDGSFGSVQQYPIAPTAFTSVSIAQAHAGTFIQATELAEMHALHGLDTANPLVNDEAAGTRTVGTISQQIALSGGRVTVTRTS